MVSAACGVPVTVTASLNSTVTRTSSPAMKNRPAVPCFRPEIVTPVTVGATASVASWATAGPPSVMACRPRPSAAGWARAERSTMFPPFRVSAEAPMLSPSASASPAATV